MFSQLYALHHHFSYYLVCSLCIRRCISLSSHCPVCRISVSSSDLVANRKLSLLIDIFGSHPVQVHAPSIVEPEPCIDLTSSSTSSSLPSCPICQCRVSSRLLESHANRCLDRSASKNAVLDSPVKGTRFTKPLPKVAYHVVKDKQLKKLLSDNNLSIGGTRKERIKRHKEFVMRFNANLDSSSPRPASEIQREMRTWDTIHCQRFDNIQLSKDNNISREDPFKKLIKDYQRRHGKTPLKKRRLKSNE